MTEHTENLVLELQRAACGDLMQIKDDIREIKSRLRSLESYVATLIGDVLRRDARIDTMGARVARIEHRLELA